MIDKIEKMARIMCQRNKSCLLCEVQSPCICKTYAELLNAEGYEIKTEDVVPRSEVEELTKENERIMREKTALECIVSTVRNQAKQEVARKIFEELSNILCENVSPRYYINDVEVPRAFKECIISDIDKLKKKYIGE